jgi:hypothetical protein
MSSLGVRDGAGALRRLGFELAPAPPEGREPDVAPPPEAQEPAPSPGAPAATLAQPEAPSGESSSSLSGRTPSSLGRPPSQGSLTIHGRIADSDGLPVAGATVRAFNMRIRDEQPLGSEVSSGADGQYTITALEEADLRPNVRVAVLGADGTEVAASSVRYGYEQNGAVDVTVPSGFGARSRFDHYRAAVQSALGAVPLGETRPSDVAVLAGATGIAASRLADLIASLVQSTGGGAVAGSDVALPADVWFAWRSAGVDFQTVWQRPTDELVATLKVAGETGTIAPRTASDLATIRDQINRVKLDLALEAPVPGTSVALKDLLSAMPAPPDLSQQRAIAGSIHELRPDDPKLADRVAAVPGFVGDAVGVAQVLRLADLTGGHLPMIQALQSHLEQAGARDGTLRPLAALRFDEWIDLAYTHGPANPQSSTPLTYAGALATAVEKQHPTAALAANLSDGRRLARQPLVTGVAEFLRSNPDFDIGTANINLVRDQTVGHGVGDSERLADGLLTLQRMRTLGASWDETATLLEYDIVSPHDILTAGPTQLSSLLEDQIPPDRAAALYASAQGLHDTTFGVFTAALSPLSAPQFPAQQIGVLEGDPVNPTDDPGLGPAPNGAEPTPDIFEPTRTMARTPVDDLVQRTIVPRVSSGPGPEKHHFPLPGHTDPTEGQPLLGSLLQQLLGSQDSCACEHCGSVLSPAAYFVDLLKFIDETKGLGTRLMSHRPDLLDLELSCNNTNTEVPAIDLALEILENAVALPMDIDLLAGANIETELGPPAGGARLVSPTIRAALQKTMTAPIGDVDATPAGSREIGTTDWTVVDAHRRWTLTARPEDGFHAESAGGKKTLLDTTHVEERAFVQAFDQSRVPEDTWAAVIKLFTKSHFSEPNYRLTITPIQAGKVWRIDFGFVAELVVHPDRPWAALRTPTTDEVWWQTTNEALIKAIEAGLEDDTGPSVIDKLVADRFENMPVRAKREGDGVWLLGSASRSMTLSFRPARLTLTSLTYQSGDPDADAVAWPENENPAAYEKLKAGSATFPWSLPVDLPLEQVRLCLERARSSRRKLIELMAPVTTVVRDDQAFALEVLGLSESEAGVIAPLTTPTDAQIYASWGLQPDAKSIWDAAAGKYFTAPSALELLKNNVSILLQQSRMTFEELKAVLAVRFVVRDGQPLDIEPHGSCTPSEMRIDTLGIEHLDRIHRFIRLQRRLTWSADDLDSAMPAGASLDGTVLARLADLVQLRDLLGVPLKEILSWWSASAVQDDSKRGHARALRLSDSELEHALALLGVTKPLDSPGDTLAFCERVIALQASAISFEDLRYVLQHAQIPGSDLALGLDVRTQLATAVRQAVTSVVKPPPPAEPPAPDPNAAAAGDDAGGARSELARAGREDAAIGVLATLLGAGRELVDYLLRDTSSTRAPLRDAAGGPAIGEFTADAFLNVKPADPPGPPGPSADAVLLRLHKAAFLCRMLSLAPADLRLLAEPPIAGELTALNLNSLPITPDDTAPTHGFEELLAFVHLRTTASGTLALDFTDEQHARATLAAVLSLTDPGQIRAAATRLGITTAEQYRSPILRARLIKLLSELQRLGATVQQAADLIAGSPDDAAAVMAKELLHAKYGDASWHDLIKPIADALRERRRDALVDYLVCDQLQGPDELYERYLIDVETGSCLKTTRLLQGITALQLFIQRVLLNLEQGLALSESQRALWEWMQNYRVWEANRKVFLFPENWLLPDLRDDKTAIFRDLEGALEQDEPTGDTAERALRGYLDAFSDLSHINVISMYESVKEAADSDAAPESTLYVVGRTPNQPYRYFWRQCTRFGTDEMAWSGWEAVDADGANDFIVPFLFEGDLHVAWPILRQTRDATAAARDTSTSDTSVQALRWEVKIAWSRRTSQGWGKRKLSHDGLTLPRLAGIPELRSFVFRLRQDAPPVPRTDLREDRVRIDCYAASDSITPPPDVKPIDPAAPQGPRNDDLANTTLQLHGYVFEKYTRDGATICRAPRVPVTVTISYTHQTNPLGDGVDLTDIPILVTTVGDLATFDYHEEAQGGYNGGVKSGTTVTLKVTHPGSAAHCTLRSTLEMTQHERYGAWNWQPVLVFEIPTPADDLYQPDREVEFNTADGGTFALTATRDMEPTYPRDAPLPPLPEDETVAQPQGQRLRRFGNQFLMTATGRVISLPGGGALDAGHDLANSGDSPAGEAVRTPDVVITRTDTVTTAPDSGEVRTSSGKTWHVRDVVGRFYVKQAESDTRRRFAPRTSEAWPDNQDFAPSYRTIAATAPTALFTPATQAWSTEQGSGPGADTPVLDNPGGQATTASQISFDRASPYASYNWELFLHVPLAVTDRLTSHQRFADARQWLHGVLDPTTADKRLGIPQYWRFRPFTNGIVPDTITKLFEWLADPTKVDPQDTDAVEGKFSAAITDWQASPFMPYLVARLRPSAYQWYALFAYIDLLISWGDQLFRRDTRESVNDATTLYIFAAKLLGPRPRALPPTHDAPAQTFRSLAAAGLDMFANAWVQYADVPGVRQTSPATTWTVLRYPAADQGLGGARGPSRAWSDGGSRVLSSLYGLAFCIPRNDKLVGLYDVIDDRLSKVRNCKNIDGVSRDLALFDPPIDPLLLIRARAAGLDLDAAISGLFAPLPYYRFSITLQKALDLAGEVKALGGSLLAALDRQDAAALDLLRSGHEIAMLKLVRDTRLQQIAEADANIVALQQTEATVMERFTQYQKLLGVRGVSTGQDGVPVVQQSSTLEVLTDPAGPTSGLGLSGLEVSQLMQTAIANQFTQAAAVAHIAAGVLAAIPNTREGTPFFAAIFGGANLSGVESAIANAIELGSAEANYQASLAGTMSGYQRRQDEWVHQSKLAAAELRQINQQILAAQIRKQIAQSELDQHDAQIANAEEVETFLRDKFTNKELFRWMASQISQVYFRSYQLALDQARRAELAYRHELGLSGEYSPVIQTGYWDNLRKGLVAGDRLYHDLKRLEAAYLDQNKREYEITKHVSLAMLDPVALMRLKLTSECSIELPEALFDIDYPGHYMRRIKAVSVSIPCVTGPYASVNCTLSLQKSTIRVNSILQQTKPRYARSDDDPGDRFVDDHSTTQSIVTSNGQNDSGLFETNLHDERYLPFEGAGVVSKWQIKLPSQFKQFDYNTISDVVMHIRYTAREGGDDFGNAATDAVRTFLEGPPRTTGSSSPGLGPPLALIVNLKQQFPSEWARLTAPGSDAPRQGFAIDRSKFPFALAGQTLTIERVDLFATSTKVSPKLTLTSPPLADTAPPTPVDLLAGTIGDPVRDPFLQLRADSYSTNGAANMKNLAFVVPDDPTAATWTLSGERELPMLRDVVLVFTYSATAPKHD